MALRRPGRNHPEVPVLPSHFARRMLRCVGAGVFFNRPLARSAPVKILVIDDHVLIREALRGVLADLNAQATVAGALGLGPGRGTE